MLGAAGVTLGTRLYASTESISDSAADQLLVDSSGDDTVRTAAFDVIRGPAWPSGYDGRVIANSFVASWDDRHDTHRQTLEDTYRGAADDDYSVQPLWAGEGLDLIHDIEPAGTIIARLVADAVSLLDAATDVLRP
jgi:nitronate monooxygenase